MVHQFFIKVHEDMPDHPKIEPLSDRAFRLLVETWCWCKRMSNDGQMSVTTWSRRGSAKARQELEVAGLVKVGDVVQVHDFLQWQSSKAQIEAKQEAKSRGARLGNHRRWHVKQGARDPQCEFCLVSVATDERSDTESLSDRSESVERSVRESTETETKTETEVKKKRPSSPAPRATDDDPKFARFWQAYPRKIGKGEARKAWTKVVQSGVDLELVIAGAERYRDDPFRRRKGDEYTKHPGPWLNAERWTDQLNGNELTPSTAWWDN